MRPPINIGDQPQSGLFAHDAPCVARELIGARLLVGGVGGMIIETEAYTASDAASHSFRGATIRNAVMFGPVGRAYVYRSYGIHWCLNFVCDVGVPGSAVLIRALQPLAGLDEMAARRGTSDVRLLCAGPGRLARALAINKTLDGAPLDAPPFEILMRTETPSIEAGPRIGIRSATETPWRYCLTGSPFLSRKPSRR